MIVARFPTAAQGIAREQALFDAGRPAVLLWQAEADALVVPQAWRRRAGVCAALPALARRGWPVVARGSGGGAVPQGPCTLNLAIATPLPGSARIADGYRLICGAVHEALSRFEVATATGAVPGSFCDGAWNLTAAGRKLAGTAQRWRATPDGRVALCHAAILVVPPADTLWPAIAALHRAAGQPDTPKPGAHVALDGLLSGRMRLAAVGGALVRAAEDRLSQLLGATRHAA